MVGVSLAIFILVTHLVVTVLLRCKIRNNMDYAGLFTMVIFTLFFLIVALNWVIYYVMMSIGEKDLASTADNLFYIGEYLSWFLIMFI